jgi:uncharacterized protein
VNVDGGRVESDPTVESTGGLDRRRTVTQLGEPAQPAPINDPSTSGVSLRPPQNRVSPVAIWYWMVRALTGWVVVVLVELGWMLGAQDGQQAWHVIGLIVTVVVAAVHLLVMPRWRYRVHRWEVTPQAIYTQAGWFHQELRIAPASRLQTIDSERGMFERLFGLTNLTVTTASAAGPLKIHGLDHATAQRLMSELMERVQATAGDAT